MPTADLGRGGLAGVRRLLDTAFAGDFGDDDWSHALGGVHVLATEDGRLVGHASVVVRQLLTGGRTLRTGYVEALATAADRRGHGVAGAVMTEVERLVDGGFELGALSASGQAVALYAGRGWTAWTGSTAALTPTGVVETPDEGVFVRATPSTPAPPHTSGRLVCDWRRGDLW